MSLKDCERLSPSYVLYPEKDQAYAQTHPAINCKYLSIPLRTKEVIQGAQNGDLETLLEIEDSLFELDQKIHEFKTINSGCPKAYSWLKREKKELDWNDPEILKNQLVSIVISTAQKSRRDQTETFRIKKRSNKEFATLF